MPDRAVAVWNRRTGFCISAAPGAGEIGKPYEPVFQGVFMYGAGGDICGGSDLVASESQSGGGYHHTGQRRAAAAVANRKPTARPQDGTAGCYSATTAAVIDRKTEFSIDSKEKCDKLFNYNTTFSNFMQIQKIYDKN